MSRCKNCNPCGGNGQNKSLTARLNKRVTILRPAGPDDKDEYGQPLNDPIPVSSVWAAIEPLRGREFFAAQAVNAEVTTRIRIRYREGIDRTMIAQHKGHTFEILYIIDPEFAHTELQLMSKERQ